MMKFRFLTFLALSAALPAVVAAPADPTQPPLPPAAADNAGMGVTPPLPATRLQLVKTPLDGGRPLAVIDGRVVRLGGVVGDSRLIRLNEQGAVLRGPQGEERLHLNPDIEKRQLPPATGRKKETP